MNRPNRHIGLILTPALLAAGLALSGCGKKDADAPAHAPKAESKAGEAAAANTEVDAGTAEEDTAKPDTEPFDAGPSKDEMRRARADAPSNVAAAPANAKKTKSGIPFVILQAGTGTDKPKGDDSLHIRYTAWDVAGKRTSTTWKIKSQEPRELSFHKMMPGWQEILGDMVVGERRLAWLPAKKAHLKKSAFKKGPRTVDFELMSLKVAPLAPKDLKSPPKDAKKTASGLIYKKLKAGTGTAHPGPKSDVKAVYAGWSRSGTCFDFSPKGAPHAFNLGDVIKGWTEGLQLMVVGDTYRFWIPQPLAYNGLDGRPGGQLVFDVELTEITAKPVK